jgi:hypothetical protein
VEPNCSHRFVLPQTRGPRHSNRRLRHSAAITHRARPTLRHNPARPAHLEQLKQR